MNRLHAKEGLAKNGKSLFVVRKVSSSKRMSDSIFIVLKYKYKDNNYLFNIGVEKNVSEGRGQA